MTPAQRRRVLKDLRAHVARIELAVGSAKSLLRKLAKALTVAER